MNFKESLFLPKTDFKMKGNLNINEPNIIKRWNERKIYENVLKKNKANKSYILHDGPPYANGNIHCGHMLNRFIKDFILRYKSMSGCYTPFIFGWDTHGLPIENQVIKGNKNYKTLPPIIFRKECEKYAINEVAKQKEQLERLGLFGDLNNSYLTLEKEYEARQLEIFRDLAINGNIFRGFKPVFWSPSSKTALAESEVEYHDIKAKTIYVLFRAKTTEKLFNKNVFFIIWTTTPWTIPANLAICVNKCFVYSLFETDKGNFIFLKEFKDILKKKFNFHKIDAIKDYTGSELENIIVEHPLYKDKTSVVILGDFVSNDVGTGCVHIAPGHGLDDYNVCTKYGLKPYCPVDENGVLDETTGQFAGLFYEEANEKIINFLEQNGFLMKVEEITHSYPHDWRTKKPVIFRATPQWFCEIKSFKKKILENIDNVIWLPEWGKEKMQMMIETRQDWCISRQRLWGVPIIIFYNEDGTPIIERNVFDNVIELVKRYGSNIWFEKEAKELLPKNYKNSHSPNGLFYKETDIMDVWFDSGTSWNILKDRQKFPADILLEGSDQYRGWFNSSLIISTISEGISPFKRCIAHGFVVDKNFDKMSKSKGNIIEPINIINKYGADTLRLWAGMIDFKNDVVISEPVLTKVSEVYFKIRNTFKFLLGNISDFNYDKTMTSDVELVDKAILLKLEDVKNTVIDNFENFHFVKIINKIVYFISNDLSKFYLNFTKDILYCNEKNDVRRKQIQKNIVEIISVLIRLLTPIIPFTMEEVNDHFHFKEKDDVMLYDFPIKTYKYVKNKELLTKVRKLDIFITNINQKIEQARKVKLINTSQEAVIYIKLSNDFSFIRDDISCSELAKILVVSNVIFDDTIKEEIIVKRSSGLKCPRCWNYVDVQNAKNIDGNFVCERCFDVLKKCANYGKQQGN
ncbi:MAG: isoleucine--tRNA ligase [Bacilli bacterium]|nr:isoleucine--tRNA ligase [Bacilli bacterium]